MNKTRDLILLEKADQMLATATTIDEVRHIRDLAEAARRYSRKIELTQSITVRAAAIKVNAERKLGQLLKTTELAAGAPGNQHTGKQLDRSHAATGPIRLRDVGLSKSESSRAQQIASLPTATFNDYVRGCIDSGQEPTTAGLLRLAKLQAVNDTILHKAPSLTRFVCDLQQLVAEKRRFTTIYADPPWKYDNQASRGSTNNHYPTMTVQQIAAEPVADLAADQAHLHLWTTNSFLPAAFSVIASWGFEYKSCFVWVKPHMGIGNYWRVSHEFLLLGVRGNLSFRDLGQRSWAEIDRRGHSCKPEEVRRLVETVSHAPYLELYGRAAPTNTDWTVYGNQLRGPPKC
jgi:N6-adenosine-specific RNA methylase IME4